jgi:hypothetical protein
LHRYGIAASVVSAVIASAARCHPERQDNNEYRQFFQDRLFFHDRVLERSYVRPERTWK